ncbi:hemagglutinin repeat-containing protein [Achromobacter xylosoxidans]
MQKHRGRLERRRQGCGAGGDQHDRRQHFLWQPVVQNRNAQREPARAGQHAECGAGYLDHRHRRGQGADSGDVVLAGTQVKAGGDVLLSADRDIELLSARNVERIDGTSSSHGGNVGIGIGAGAGGYGINVSAGVNAGKGREKDVG